MLYDETSRLEELGWTTGRGVNEMQGTGRNGGGRKGKEDSSSASLTGIYRPVHHTKLTSLYSSSVGKYHGSSGTGL